jgi:hypothetical protein
MVPRRQLFATGHEILPATGRLARQLSLFDSYSHNDWCGSIFTFEQFNGGDGGIALRVDFEVPQVLTAERERPFGAANFRVAEVIGKVDSVF